MSTRAFRPPADIGAANVQIISADGRTLAMQQLVSPGGTIAFDAPDEGQFYARVTPIGDQTRVFRFHVTPDSPAEIESAPTTPEPVEWRWGERRVPQRGRRMAFGLPPFTPPFTAFPTVTTLAASVSAPASPLGVRESVIEPVERRIAVGLSHDEAPLRFGGWRAYSGPWRLAQARAKDGWVLEVLRGASDAPLTTDNARLRVHVAIEARSVIRALIPVYQGGTSLSVKIIDGEATLSITPRDPILQQLLQAFGGGTETETMELLDRVARSNETALDQDPWAMMIFGLLARQRHPAAFSEEKALSAADRFPWMSDASVVAANLVLANEEPDVDAALDQLVHARRIGAPYLAQANALLGDLLVILSADAPQERQRKRAAHELAIWRRRIPFQSSIGPHFAWLTRTGQRNRGRLDNRYMLPVLEDSFWSEGRSPATVGPDLTDLPDPYLDATL